METIFRIKPNELTVDFLEKLKILFQNEGEIEISISPISDFGLIKKEDNKEYQNRVNKAIRNLEENKNSISLSEVEFDALANDLGLQK
jgi:hypothetical protein